MDLPERNRKYLSSFITLLLLGIFLYSPWAVAADITVIIRGIRPNIGTIRLTLHDNPTSFKEKDYQAAFAALEIKPKSSELRITFHDIPTGQYAVAIHHDENDDDKLNMGPLGPTEGYAFSDHWSGIGTPSFNKAALKVNSQNLSVFATMHY
jgi:uncharacterized protein (DUF2141 family)